MRPVIAVEAGLEPIRGALQDEGYGVIQLESPGWRDADAVIVGGMDQNLASFQEAGLVGPVILAAGRTADEVVREVARRLG